jgi:hypothetical protein
LHHWHFTSCAPLPLAYGLADPDNPWPRKVKA